MIVLGLDPAIRTSGYGVITVEPGGRMKVLDCGVIVNKPKMPHSECVRRLFGGVNEILDHFAVEHAAIESPFVGRNSSTAIILGMARGAILTALALRSIPCWAYMPSKAKLAAVGKGSASKEQVAALIAMENHIAVEDIPLDATDALAIAICHAQIAIRSEAAMLSDRPL
ncbi:MAG: crossover junction endodeoxyribonuclease RuvC [Victivallaceae bacterium]|nr:crossover junction endodeoxyribonuclease RuvC [Victivallaceae bacterium]